MGTSTRGRSHKKWSARCAITGALFFLFFFFFLFDEQRRRNALEMFLACQYRWAMFRQVCGVMPGGRWLEFSLAGLRVKEMRAFSG